VSAPGSLEDVLEAVRARGLRASSARRLVLAALCSADRPVSAETIAGGLAGRLPSSDIGSVYRNLVTLVEAGIVRDVHPAQGATLYALARAEGEGFVACERCGEVRRASPSAVAYVRAAVQRALGYEAGFTRHPIVGVCADCAGRSGV
jgi:Fe2+ or Zn2+ uptake regulation protein